MKEDNPNAEPLDEGLPEWPTVEAERDYWKKLARDYGQKLAAIRHPLGTDWVIEPGGDGKQYIVQRGGEPRVLAGVEEVFADD